MDFESLGIKIDLPNILLFKGQGVLSAIGYFLTLILALLLVIWVGYSIYAGYKIITSNMAKGLEEGVNIIKNIWIGITMGIAFFALISVLGTFMGIGNITSWHTTLAQCHDATGGFYFKDVQEQIAIGIPEKGNSVYCCKVTKIDDADEIYKNSSFIDGTYHYILSNSSSPSGFEDCEKF